MDKTIELKTGIQKTQNYNYAPSKRVVNTKKQWMYLKNACCLQLNLVHWNGVNHTILHHSHMAYFPPKKALCRFAEAVTSFGDRIEVDLFTIYFIRTNEIFLYKSEI